tara:strand:+ start:1204 stop:1374 length:171 start_codon:yes stop_codon:yes gene_type:complete
MKKFNKTTNRVIARCGDIALFFSGMLMAHGEFIAATVLVTTGTLASVCTVKQYRGN